MELVELLSALELPEEPPATKTPGAPTKYLVDSLSDEVFFALSSEGVRRKDDVGENVIALSKIGDVGKTRWIVLVSMHNVVEV